MRLQVQADEIKLLPTCSSDCPSRSGCGLNSRGGFELDVAHAADKLTSITFQSQFSRVLDAYG
jgi:hypothetical protein